MSNEFYNSLDEFSFPSFKEESLEFNRNREYSHDKYIEEKEEVPLKSRFNNVSKMMKLATSVSLTATSLGVSTAVIVPIIKPVEKPKKPIVIVEEKPDIYIPSEFAVYVNGDWSLVGIKNQVIDNDASSIIRDDVTYSDEVFTFRLDEVDKEDPVLYINDVPFMKVDDNVFYSKIEKDSGVFDTYISFIDDLIEIKEVGEMHSSISEEGSKISQSINYYYFSKLGSDSIYEPGEISVIEEENNEDYFIEEELPEEEVNLEDGRNDISEEGEKFNPNEVIEDETAEEQPEFNEGDNSEIVEEDQTPEINDDNNIKEEGES